MSRIPAGTATHPLVPAAFVAGSVGLLSVAVVGDVGPKPVAVLVGLTAIVALSGRVFVGWRKLLATLILIILFIPIRRYALPGNLPFQLEPYRIFVAFFVLGWVASLLVDSRTRFRRTGLEGPVLLLVGSAIASIIANPGRVSATSSEVNKSFTFFLSFIIVLYATASVIRRLDDVDYLAKTLVWGGAVVAFFAIVEARTGFNVFNHLSRVLPFLTDLGSVGGFARVGTAKLRVFGSAQHPIALSAALVMLMPLALYLARRYRQRRWWLCALLFAAAIAATISRTGIIMCIVIAIVFLWLRPRETRRLWPAIFPALLAIHFVLPGTLGAIKQSFFPAGGLVAQQKVLPGQSGSGRLADLGPGIQEWKRQPLFGEGYGTRIVEPSNALSQTANILDNQWLGTALETGALGVFAWLWLFIRVVRRFGKEAKRDESERGWLLASIAAGVAAYAVGMVTYDAFSFIQVTFLLFIFIGIGSALMAERPTPLAVRTSREEQRRTSSPPLSSPART